jgi:hypothetical protein
MTVDPPLSAAEASGAGLDPAAVALALGGASREKAGDPPESADASEMGRAK